MARLVSSFSPPLPPIFHGLSFIQRAIGFGIDFYYPFKTLWLRGRQSPAHLHARSWLHPPPTPPIDLVDLRALSNHRARASRDQRQPLGPLTLHAWPWC
jgi:hypothetical protein